MNSKTVNRYQVYPKYTYENKVYRTYVRKLHEDKWYLFPVMVSNADLPYFLKQVYLCILFGIIDIELIDLNGNEIYKLDENQEEESHRLMPIFN